MIEHYATYVLHLERALVDIEETLSLVNPLLASNKKIKSKDKGLVKEQKILAKIIMVSVEHHDILGMLGYYTYVPPLFLLSRQFSTWRKRQLSKAHLACRYVSVNLFSDCLNILCSFRVFSISKLNDASLWDEG